jgi:hypothetical protein
MHPVRRVLKAGRIGRTRSFVAALGMAALVLPVVTALAFFAATGSGTIANVQAGTPNSVVSITADGAYTYAGPSTTNLMPGGTVSFPLRVACTAGCPAQVTTINLQSWTSNTAGCDSATFPNSFSMPTITINTSVDAVGSGGWGPAVITWANLAVTQNPCAGALFAFVLVTP